jgi:hypothetical protein
MVSIFSDCLTYSVHFHTKYFLCKLLLKSSFLRQSHDPYSKLYLRMLSAIRDIWQEFRLPMQFSSLSKQLFQIATNMVEIAFVWSSIKNIRGFHLSSNMATIGFVNRVTVSIYHDTLYNNVVLQVICEHLYFTHMRKAHDLTN